MAVEGALGHLAGGEQDGAGGGWAGRSWVFGMVTGGPWLTVLAVPWEPLDGSGKLAQQHGVHSGSSPPAAQSPPGLTHSTEVCRERFPRLLPPSPSAAAVPHSHGYLVVGNHRGSVEERGTDLRVVLKGLPQ